MDRTGLSLHQKLTRMRERTKYGHLVPKSSFMHEITKRDIEDEVRSGSMELPHGAVEFIWTRARKLFSILVLCSRANLIVHFMENDQMQARNLDDLLPMDESSLRAALHSRTTAEKFFREQWAFCAPDFSQLVYPRHLHRYTVLPIVKEDKLGRGAFGVVTKIEFHQDYRPEGSESKKEFVRKELDRHDSTYENEVSVLFRLQSLNHPNILKLTACYTYNDKHNIISPYMAGGTLETLFAEGSLAKYAHHDILHLMSGLSSAIWALHEIYEGVADTRLKGLHSDLRPVNILVDEGRLVLADFGLSSIKDPFGDSKTAYKAVPDFYQAPECADLKHPFNEYHSTRASDIWALGCMLTDILVLMTKGRGALQSFQSSRKNTIDRTTYYLYHDGKQLVKAVSDVLYHAKQKQKESSLSQLAEHVDTMLEIDPDYRSTARLAAAHMYCVTVTAFSEVISVHFGRFEQIAPAAIEKARFDSWMLSFDTIIETGLPATSMTNTFDNVVSVLRRLIEALEVLVRHSPSPPARAFSEVRHINTELFDLLPERGRQSVIIDLRSRVLNSLKPETVAAVRDPLTAIPYGGDIAAMADYKHRYARLEHSSKAAGSRTWTQVPGQMKLQFTVIRNVSCYNIAKVEGRGHPRLVLEETITSYDEPHHRELNKRLEALCDLLFRKPNDLRAPPIFGLHTGSTDFTTGLLYDLGEHNISDSSIREPLVLRDLLEIQDLSERPCLGTRLRLASQLADALRTFHDLDWYHKDLTSRSVIFLPNATGAARANCDPHIVGFQHSRHANASYSEGPHMKIDQRYHDPRYLGRRGSRYNEFRPEYDYYSLGILLSEIALWQPVGRIMHSSAKTSKSEFSKLFRQEVEPQLRFAVGKKYADAVMGCLNGTFDTIETFKDAPAARLLFQREVASPLRDLTSNVAVIDDSHISAMQTRKPRALPIDVGSQSSHGRSRKRPRLH